jgi:hypothetical protein
MSEKEKPAEPESKVYRLTEAEQLSMQQLDGQLQRAKAQIFDLNVQLELAQKTLMTAEARFHGAAAMLTDARGWKTGQFAPDFSRYTRKD